MKLWAFAIIALLLVEFSAAVQYSEYTIKGDSVLVNHKFTDAAFLNISIPKDAEAISVSGNGQTVPYGIMPKGARKQLSVAGSYSALEISFVTRELVEQPKNTFFVEEVTVHDHYLKVKVTLPERAALAEPLFSGFGSIYPKPSRAETDGQAISFYWELQAAENTFPLLIEYTSIRQDNSLLILAGLGSVALGGILAFFIAGKKKAGMEQPRHESSLHLKIPEEEKKENEAQNIELHLKEDEKAVINVLKLKNGSTTQSTLRIATGFSKATLSRLLMELEVRNIIIKEKRGNKNLVILKSSIWNDLEQE